MSLVFGPSFIAGGAGVVACRISIIIQQWDELLHCIVPMLTLQKRQPGTWGRSSELDSLNDNVVGGAAIGDETLAAPDMI